jgi:Rad3-related DNA helicase
MALKVKEICDMHPHQSGIIHAGNFGIAEFLVDELQGEGTVPHLILHHNPKSEVSRDVVIANYLELASTQPVLLISPSITEGLDLKNDLGRFCIFVKVPYPNLGDAWVKRRFELSKEWYNRQALINIIQGSGRIVRSNTDWGNTFILDSSWETLHRFSKRYIPSWWLAAYQEI